MFSSRIFHLNIPSDVLTVGQFVISIEEPLRLDFIAHPLPRRRQTVYEYRVIKEGDGVLANSWQLQLELNKGDCLRIYGDVYRIRSVSVLGPAVDNRRELHVSETLDTIYAASLD